MTSRIRLLAILAFLIASTAFAADFGLQFMNLAGYQDTGETDWYSEHEATAWVTFPVGKGGSSFGIEGFVNASKPASTDDFTYFANVSLFRLSIQESAAMNVDIGRFPTMDLTGILLNQTIDGIEFKGSFAFGNMSVLGGYTGLLNARDTGAVMTADDLTDTLTDDVYALGSKRALAKMTFHFPELAGPFDVFFEGLGQYDLRDTLSDAVETVHTGYGTFMLSGPMSPSVFFTVSGTFQTGILESDKKYSENAALGSVRFDVFPAPKNHLFGEFLYTTAESASLTTVLPITSQTPGTLYAGSYKNLMKASAGWYFNPLKQLNLDLTGNMFFFSEKPVGQDSVYGATEITGGATFRTTSDLNFRLNGTLLFPNEDDMQYQAEVKAVLSL